VSALPSWRAVTWLTIVESWRQKVWALFAITALGLLLMAPELTATVPSDRIKLAVVAVTAATGFVTTLLAILVGAAQLRRDLDARVAFMLFAKPLPRLSYLLGRWCGVVILLAGGLLVLALAGSAVIAWQNGQQIPEARSGQEVIRGGWALPTTWSLPRMRAVITPDGWDRIGSLGQVTIPAQNQSVLSLDGVPGDGVRFHLAGLDPAKAGPDGYEVLLRAQVHPYDTTVVLDHCLVEVLAGPGIAAQPAQAGPNATADQSAMRVLALDPKSPYGTSDIPGRILLRSKDQSHRDFDQDFCHLRLPASLIGKDGRVDILVVRLEGRAGLRFPRGGSSGADGSVLVAVSDSGFIPNLLRGLLVVLAVGALLCAWTLLLSTISNLAVALLGGLTLFFAGHAVWTISDTLEFEKLSLPVRRMLTLALDILPDFEHFNVGTNLASGQVVAWHTVGAAWIYYGTYTAIFLLLAWFILARREVV
jgi:ABC-type transport system involved in multi-copper enzyme maturation permease subunit